MKPAVWARSMEGLAMHDDAGNEPSTSSHAQTLEISSSFDGPYNHLDCSANAVVGYVVSSEVACLTNANYTGGKVCDGGACVTAGCTIDAACGGFKCQNGACLTRCSDNSHCSAGNGGCVDMRCDNGTCITCITPYVPTYCSAQECRRDDMCHPAAHCSDALTCEWDVEGCENQSDEPCGM
jgi:hypothetical protein